MNLIVRLLSIFSFLFPLKLFIQVSGKKVIYPFYHIIDNNPPDHIKHLYKAKSINEFKRDLDFVCNIFAMAQWLIPRCHVIMQYLCSFFHEIFKLTKLGFDLWTENEWPNRYLKQVFAHILKEWQKFVKNQMGR